MSNMVEPITYDRSRITVGVMHFGVGNFHRSHQAMYLDRLLRNPETFEQARSWGICGVGVLPGDAPMRDALRGQDYEYTLIERHPDGAAPATRIGAIVDYLHAPDELDAVLERLADPAIRIVSLTITEGGYNISDRTGDFDTSNPAIIADTVNRATPRTVFGIIVAGLQWRRARGIEPFTVMSCDNIEGNGDIARRCFTAYARLIDAELAGWISSHVAFPNSMVDRITPVTTQDDRAWVLERFGVDDAWPVLSEDFTQWVLEDRFPSGRPPLEAAGVQLVDDVRPYELMKLRLLNASHQALAYAGILSGYVYAHEAASDPVIADLLRAYMDREATPTLPAVPGVDLHAYKDRLIQRFGNAFVRDTLARLATDASDRIPKWLVPVIRERRRAGAAVPLSASVVAGWATYAQRYFSGEPLPFQDRQEAAVRNAVADSLIDPVEFLGNSDWFGDLADDIDFATEYRTVYEALNRERDPRHVLRRLVRA